MRLADTSVRLTKFKGQIFPDGEQFDAQLTALFTYPIEATDKERLPQWSPTLFEGDYRKRDNAKTVTCFASDIDEWHGSSIDFGAALAKALSDAYCLWHSTMSSEPGALRWRLAVALRQTILASEFLPLWRAMQLVLAQERIYLDPSTKDVSKAYLWPARKPGGVWHAGAVGFRGIDVESAISAGRRIITAEHLEPVSVGPVRYADKYVDAAIAREVEAVRTAGKGTRNATLSRAAFALARLDGVSGAEVLGVLLQAGLDAGLPKNEIRLTVMAALRARGKAA
jgi:hypothetical protein